MTAVFLSHLQIDRCRKRASPASPPPSAPTTDAETDDATAIAETDDASAIAVSMEPSAPPSLPPPASDAAFAAKTRASVAQTGGSVEC